MGKLTAGHILETALWLGFALFLYAYSFEFDRPIEIYEFGATAWPRAIILMIVLAALGNLYYHWRHGDQVMAQSIGGSGEEGEAGTERATGYYLRLGGILVLPFLYAFLMESIGFYTLTPFFIAGVIFLMGERRIAWILGITLASYAVILLLFAKLLYVGLPVGTVRPFYDFSNWLLALLQNT